jgi:hypothetical protein
MLWRRENLIFWWLFLWGEWRDFKAGAVYWFVSSIIIGGLVYFLLGLVLVIAENAGWVGHFPSNRLWLIFPAVLLTFSSLRLASDYFWIRRQARRWNVPRNTVVQGFLFFGLPHEPNYKRWTTREFYRWFESQMEKF